MKNEFFPFLQKLGLKATPKRLALLELLAAKAEYESPEYLWKRLKRRFPGIGLPTVYRNLEELEAGGVITKVIHPDRRLYYFFCGHSAHHHHFVCMSCRKVEDFHSCAMHEMEKEIRKKIRGKVFSHILQVNGLCRQCAQ